MFSTPLICCSSGVTTVAATTSALAPGYWPVMLTTGGAISGYCAIGSRPKETTPRMTKTRDTTPAKIGRSMKKREMRMGRSGASVGRGLGNCGERRGVGTAGRFLRRHLDARTRPHQAVDDDAVVGAKAAVAHGQPTPTLPNRPVFRPRHVLAVDHEHELAHLLGTDGHVRHEQRLLGSRDRHLNATEHPGRK